MIATSTRRRLLPLLIVLTVAGTRCSSVPCHAPLPDDSPSVYRWGCARLVDADSAKADKISVTNQANGALSVLFTGAGVILQPPSTALTQRWTSFLAFPITSTSPEPTPVRCQVMGYIMKSATAHAAALIDIGGAAVTLDYPAGAALDEKILREVDFLSPSKNGVTFPLSIVATGSRRSTSDELLFTIDGVDCAVVPPTP